MEKDNTSAGYQLPPLDLLDEYVPEDKVSEEKIANGRRVVVRMHTTQALPNHCLTLSQ